MRKEYIFALIFAILCFLEGNYYSTYNSKKRTLFVNKGIATELHLSERTVEERMAKALKFLRHFLSDFLFWITFIVYW